MLALDQVLQLPTEIENSTSDRDKKYEWISHESRVPNSSSPNVTLWQHQKLLLFKRGIWLYKRTFMKLNETKWTETKSFHNVNASNWWRTLNAFHTRRKIISTLYLKHTFEYTICSTSESDKHAVSISQVTVAVSKPTLIASYPNQDWFCIVKESKQIILWFLYVPNTHKYNIHAKHPQNDAVSNCRYINTMHKILRQTSQTTHNLRYTSVQLTHTECTRNDGACYKRPLF